MDDLSKIILKFEGEKGEKEKKKEKPKEEFKLGDVTWEEPT